MPTTTTTTKKATGADSKEPSSILSQQILRNTAVSEEEFDEIPNHAKWESLTTAGLITEKDRTLLEHVPISDEDDIVLHVESNLESYVELCFRILSDISHDDPLKFVLYVVDIMCTRSEQFLEKLYLMGQDEMNGATDVNGQNAIINSGTTKAPAVETAAHSDKKKKRSKLKPYSILLKLGNKTELFILEKTFSILSKLLDFNFKNNYFCPKDHKDSSKVQQTEMKLLDFDSENPENENGAKNSNEEVAKKSSIIEMFVDIVVRHLQNAVNMVKSDRKANNETFKTSFRLARMCARSLMSLLRHSECRNMFHSLGGISSLIYSLKLYSFSVQHVYEISFCLWCLTYNSKTFSFLREEKVVPRLHDVLRNTTKEKVIRVVILTYQNLLCHNGMLSDMVSVGVPKTLNNLLKRKFQDQDIEEKVQALSNELEKHIEEISSFDDYKQEVLSGRLEWSPVHSSEKFWKESLAKFEQNQCSILKELIKLLDMPEELDQSTNENTEKTKDLKQQRTQVVGVSPESDIMRHFSDGQNFSNVIDDNKNMAIACHDIGQFVRYHPRGKKIVAELGAKNKVLQLMEHSNAEVRKHALLCVQKIMINNWEFL